MKRFLIAALLISSVAGFCQSPVPSGVYAWPAKDKGTLLNGVARDMRHLELTAQAVQSGKKKTTIKPTTEEQLLIVRSGTVTIHLNDSVYSIGTGSIALIIPGDSYAVENKGSTHATYYLMKYAAENPDADRAK